MGPRHQALSYQMLGYRPFSILTSANMKMHMFAAAKMQTIGSCVNRAAQSVVLRRSVSARRPADCIPLGNAALYDASNH